LISDPDQNGSHGDVVRCRGCGLMFRNRRKVESGLKRNYDSLDYEQPSREWIESRIASFHPYLPMLERWRGNGSPAGAASGLAENCIVEATSSGRICDVGAGHGFTLAACREAGWECHGVEVAGGAVQHARRELGLDMFHGTLREAKFPSGHFDVVLFWNVLDEMPHPTEELAEALRILRPGGGVLVRVRNGAVHVPMLRWIRTVHGDVGKDISAVVHLYGFDRRRLQALAERSGFCEIRVRNARLTWTVMYGTTGASSPIRKLILLGVRTASGILALVSGNRSLLAPSLVMTAEKPISASRSTHDA
jgi:SAM-dependent methyltransferase